MKLNKSNFLKLCEVAWDISHDGTGKQIFLEYSPHVEWLNLKLYLNGWSEGADPDTKYTLKESSGSTFSQSCDPDDILEALQAMAKEEATPEIEMTLNRYYGLAVDCFKKTEADE